MGELARRPSVADAIPHEPERSGFGARFWAFVTAEPTSEPTLTKDLWMAGATELGSRQSSTELDWSDLGAGRWRHAEQQHWISDYHSDAIAGDGHLHLWADERSHWYVTSSIAWESFKQHPEGGTGGEYPHVISDGPRGTPVGSFQSGCVRFSVYTQQDHEHSRLDSTFHHRAPGAV